MDLAGNYQPPFSPSTMEGSVCVCVCCGRSGTAEFKISTYPHRYIPRAWSVNAHNQALRCDTCVRDGKTQPIFWSQNMVWIDFPHPHHPDYAVRERPRMTSQQRARPGTNVLPDHRGRSTLQEAYENANQITLNEEEQPMPNAEEASVPVTRTDRIKQQGKEVGGALAEGFALAAVNETGEVLVDMAQELFSEIPSLQLILEHPDGREAAKLMMATALHTATAQTDFIPQGEFIGEACKKQMTVSTLMLAAPRFNKVRKHLQKLANIGQRTASPVVRARVESRVSDIETEYDEMQEELKAMRAQLEELRAENEELTAAAAKPKARKRSAKAS